ncbi:carboxypeptidase regulatory-like domain-containing protein [Corynebacterium sp. Marseille-P4321]|uniref:carboxypeptidase regulatory-like domain-containing protein n=1 Tax=Corynebacterium sp. Marseille-P4321 TaxID=2736603 RepID=UPI001C377828|nr:carboxypeptidase regulatory-like domain-containing protein [Corynebacterium sp. Marseille-P4321]
MPTGLTTIKVVGGVPGGYSVFGEQSKNVTTAGVSGVNFTTTRDAGVVAGFVDGLPEGASVTVSVVNAAGDVVGKQDGVRGTYRIPGVPTGDHTVRVSGWKGYSSSPVEGVSVSVKKDAQETANFDFSRDAGVVAGFVDGLPEGATVTVSVVNAAGDVVDKRDGVRGVYEIDGLDPGDYTVRVSGWKGYSASPVDGVPVSVKKDAQETANFNFSRDAGVVAGSVDGLPEGATVTVSVVNAAGDVVDKRDGVRGTYRIPGVPTGDHTVRVSGWKGYSSSPVNGVTVSVKKNAQETANFDFSRDAGVVAGFVDGLPEGASVTVSVVNAAGDVVGKQDGVRGTYRIPGVPTGDHTVRVSGWKGYSSSPVEGVSVSVKKDAQETANFNFSRLKGWIEGTVRGEEGNIPRKLTLLDQNREPVEGVDVRVGDDGKINSGEVPTGTYTLRVESSDEWFALGLQVEVENNRPAQVKDIPLAYKPGTITGTVVGPSNKALTGVKADLLDSDGNLVENANLKIGEKGNLTSGKIPHGEYEIRITASDDFQVKKQPVSVKPGKEVSVGVIELEEKQPPVTTKTVTSTTSPTTAKATTSTTSPTTAKATTSTTSPKSAPTTAKATTSTTSTTVVSSATSTVATTADKPSTTVAAKPTTSAVQPTTTNETVPPKETGGTITVPLPKDDGELIPGTTVIIRDSEGNEHQVTVDQDGDYTVEIPGEGNQEVIVRDPNGGEKSVEKNPDGNFVAEIPGDGNSTIIIRDSENKEREIKVDPEGNFVVPVPEDDTYRVIVEFPEDSPFRNPEPVVVEVKEGQNQPIPPIEVEKKERPREEKAAQGPRTISGWVTDQHGNPIEGAKVEIEGKFRDRRTEDVYRDPRKDKELIYSPVINGDPDGYFITDPIDFSNYPEADFEFRYRVQLPEGWPADVTEKDGKGYTEWFTSDKPLTVDEPVSIGDIRIDSPLGRAEGTLLDDDGNPVEGATVVVKDANGNYHTAETDADGKFVVEKLLPGEATVKIITKDGDRPVDPFSVAVRPGEAVEIPTISLTKEQREGNTVTKLSLEKKVWGYNADSGAEGEVLNMVKGDPKGLMYTFVITNEGNEPVSNIVIDDPVLKENGVELLMPDGWTAQSSLAAGETKIFTAHLAETPDGLHFSNTAVATGKSGKHNVASDPDTAYVKFMNMTTEKKVNARFATNPDEPVRMVADDTAFFTYEVVNTGATPMENVSVSDTVYEGKIEEFDPNNPGEGTALKVTPEKVTLLPGQRAVFKAEVKGLKSGIRHHNAAQATGHVPERPQRGGTLADGTEYEDPSSVLIIRPRENIKGNAHIIVEGDDIDSGTAQTDIKAVTWVDANGNGVQDPGEGVEGVGISLRKTRTNAGPSAVSGEEGNLLWEKVPSGEYYFVLPDDAGYVFADYDTSKGSRYSKTFTAAGRESVQDLQLVAIDAGAPPEAEGSSLGKCLSTASSASNPVAWLVPIGLLTLTLGGIGVLFEDELNAAAANVNRMINDAMPGVNINIQTPEWVNQIQAQIDQVNRQLAEINPAAPAAVAGAAILALAGLVTALYWLSCEAGWADPQPEAGSSGSSEE